MPERRSETVEHLRAMLLDDVVPNDLPDTELLLEMLAAPHAPSPILLSMGETFEAPASLCARLAMAPRKMHGYLFSMWGLPQCRQAMKRYVAETERWPDPDAFELAVSWAGTRSAMQDFGQLVLDRVRRESDKPVVLTTSPGWDYSGALLPLGFEVEYIALAPESNFRVTIPGVRAAVERIEKAPGRTLALVVVNPQHNPTGANYSTEVAKALVAAAYDRGAGLLVDNAYFGVSEEPTACTSLMESLANSVDAGWNLVLAVRSFGKAFDCNGWSLGSLSGPPTILDELVNRYRIRHSFNCHGVLQYSMADWIRTGEAARYADEKRGRLRAARSWLQTTGRLLLGLDDEPDALHVGSFAPYALMMIPKRYRKRPAGVRTYIADVARTCRVLFSDARIMLPISGKDVSLPFVRVFWDKPVEVLEDAFSRIARSGLGH